MASPLRLARSSLGGKYLMALTGLLLIGFILGHMAGNLLIYAGADALNSYAHALKSKPPLLWAARLGLFVVFLVHIGLGLKLTRQNIEARPVRYVREDTIRASWASRHMLLTGLLVLAFLLYHLAQFTFGVVNKAEVQVAGASTTRSYLELAELRESESGRFVSSTVELSSLSPGGNARHDVYRMVVSGFSVPLVSISYLVAMVFLALHLWHGGSSWFQSLGLNNPSYDWLTRGLGPFLAIVVFVGNCSIPIAVLLGIVR